MTTQTTEAAIMGVVSGLHRSQTTESLFRLLKAAAARVLGTSDLSVILMNIEDDCLFVEVSSVLPKERPLEQDAADFLRSVLLTNSMDKGTSCQSGSLAGSYVYSLRHRGETFGVLVIHQQFQEDTDDPTWTTIVDHFGQALANILRVRTAEEELIETRRHMHVINEMGTLFGTFDLDILLAKIMETALRVANADVGSLMLEEKGHLSSKIEWGLSDVMTNSILRPDGEDFIEHVYRGGAAVLVTDQDVDKQLVYPDDYHIGSLLCVPMYTMNRGIGVLTLINPFSEEEDLRSIRETVVTLAGMAATAIENAQLYELEVEQEKLREQLRIAQRIHSQFLPRAVPQNRQANVFAVNKPTSMVGGDFYDFVEDDSSKLGIIIGDVSGKGISAALLMAIARTAFRSQAPKHKRPDELLKAANQLLLEESNGDRFVTALCTQVDFSSCQVRVASAGHGPLLRYRRNHGDIIQYMPEGLPLGIFPDTNYALAQFPVDVGDILVMITDGVIEAMNPEHELFGIQRLERLVRENCDLSPQNLVLKICETLEQHRGQASQNDDVTIVVGNII